MKIRITEAKLPQQNKSKLVREFIKYCINELKLKSPLPKVKLTNNKNVTETYGHYSPNDNEIVVYTGNRNLGDSLRTIAHELEHARQRQNGEIKNNSGETGSREENLANSKAGVLLREFGRKNPQIFE